MLKETVDRYNGFVAAGKDADFDKPAPKFPIKTGPFYAAWATFVAHDSYAGLRINEACQVLDFQGKVIDGLYCSQHGLGRCVTQGYIIGQQIAKRK